MPGSARSRTSSTCPRTSCGTTWTSGWTVTDVAEVPDGAFDVVLIAHVLEHVADDRRAMREPLRVTRPGGCALLPTPVEEDRPVTYEDTSITTPAGRAVAFGQADHVRRYGRDFPQRL